MAVPKRKMSRSNTRSRRSQWKATADDAHHDASRAASSPTPGRTGPAWSPTPPAPRCTWSTRAARSRTSEAAGSASMRSGRDTPHADHRPTPVALERRARGHRRPGPARAGADPPVVRVRERQPADERAAGVPRRRRARAGRHRRAVPPASRTCPRASSPSCAPRSSTCARSPTSRARLGLGDYILLGRGEETSGGRDKSSILADTLEALIGAVYLEHGIDVGARLRAPARRPAARCPPPRSAPGLDWKTSLQELTATAGLGVPEYVVAEEGPDHAKIFHATVVVAGERARHRRRPEQEGGRAAGGRRGVPAARADVPAAAGRRVRHRLRPTARVGVPTDPVRHRLGPVQTSLVPELPEVEVVRRGLARWVDRRPIDDVEVLHPRPVRRHEAGPVDFAARLDRAARPGRRPPRQVPLARARLRRGAAGASRDERPAPPAAHRTPTPSGTCGCGSDSASTTSPTLTPRPPRAPCPSRMPAAGRRSPSRRTAASCGSSTSGCSAAWPSSRSCRPRDGAAPRAASGTSPTRRRGRRPPRCIPPPVAHIARDLARPARSTSAGFAARLRARRTGIKRALLDQTLVSGIGNIYADEALWRVRAALRPADPDR